MFYGYETRPRCLDKIPEKSINRVPFRKCSTGRVCRGEFPFRHPDGSVWWRFIYQDGDPDDGITISKCTTTIGQNTFTWFEE